MIDHKVCTSCYHVGCTGLSPRVYRLVSRSFFFFFFYISVKLILSSVASYLSFHASHSFLPSMAPLVLMTLSRLSHLLSSFISSYFFFLHFCLLRNRLILPKILGSFNPTLLRRPSPDCVGYAFAGKVQSYRQILALGRAKRA